MKKILIIINTLFIMSNFLFAQVDFPGEGNNIDVKWLDYALADGTVVQDPVGDINTPELDIVSSEPGDPSSVAVAFDGENAFFRIQLGADPIVGGKINSGFGAFAVQLAAPNAVGESDYKVMVGVDGKSNPDRVYITDQSGSMESTVYTSTGFRTVPVTNSSPTTYYMEWQVPLATIANIWSGFNAYTPMKMFYGTSTSLQTITKDFMTGTSVDFTIVSLADFESVGAGETTSNLPVELNFFDGVAGNDSVELIWETVTEVNNFGFNIERSIDSSKWNLIGFVQGYGTTNSPKYYSFSDTELPSADEVYYRLKQVDLDGSFAYSELLVVNLSSVTSVAEEKILSYSLKQNYPNPFNPSTKINFEIADAGMVSLSIYNVIGEKVATLVNEFKSQGMHTVNFNATNLSAGIYIYQLKSGKFVETKKMNLLK